MKDFSPTRGGTLLAESLILSGTFPVWGRGGKLIYRHLFLALAITGASCGYQKSADYLMANNQTTTTDAMTNDGVVFASYDSRDDSIEVTSTEQAVRPLLEDRVLALVNRERHQAGVKPLSFSTELAHAAHQHSATMAAAGFFEHRGEGEPKLFDRVTASGMDTDHVGENIFETSEGVSGAVADECVQMWMQSTGHRMNMLSPEFDKTGISVGISQNGENYITEDFAH
jgi:uncharacterized protein YkwD